MLAILEEPGLVCEDDRLDAVAEAEFLQDVRDVRLDSRLADVELPPDLYVGQAIGDEPEDVFLAGGELVQLFGGEGRGMRVNCLITRLVIAGERSASPAATVRTAAISCSGGSSLSTNPLAPARSAS